LRAISVSIAFLFLLATSCAASGEKEKGVSPAVISQQEPRAERRVLPRDAETDAPTYELSITEETLSRVFSYIRSNLDTEPDRKPAGSGTLGQELQTEWPLEVFVNLFPPQGKKITVTGTGKTISDRLITAIADLKRAKLPQGTSSAPIRVDFVIRKFLPESLLEVSSQFVPGIDGIEAESAGKKEHYLPGDLLAGDIGDSRTLEIFLSVNAQEATLRRFRTISCFQRDAGEKPQILCRSLPNLPVLNTKMLTERIAGAGEYLIRTQRPDGSFQYLYTASRDKVAEEKDDYARQAGASCGMVQLYLKTNDKRFLDSANRCLKFLTGKLGRSEKENFAFLPEPDGTVNLGGASLLLWAICNYRVAAKSDEFAQEASRLAKFILSMQKEDGAFYTDYRPESGERTARQARYYPSEALLALAWHYQTTSDEEVLRSALRGAEALAKKHLARLQAGGLKEVDVWLMKAAFCLYPHATGEQRKVLLEVSSKFADMLVNAQRTKETANQPDLAGAFTKEVALPACPSVAALTEGLADYYRLTKLYGKRRDDVRDTLILAAEFQLRHQYWDDNSYFLPNPQRAKGGFHATLADSTIRIDYIKHSISSLIGALEALGDRQ
jgi:hypothetical protein